MTREEAIEILEEVRTIDDSMYQYNEKYLQALDMAIKALEHLDEIRAEIIELRSKQNVGVLECLDIIDKYREETQHDERRV